LGQTAPSAWKSPKTQFWGLLANWKFEPSPWAPHTLTSSSINTQNSSKNYLWIYHGMHWTLCYRSKLSITLKSKDLATRGFQTKIHRSREPSFWKVSLPPAKLHMLFPTHLWFWPQIYSFWQALDWDWGLLSKILASTKMGGA